MEKVETRRQFLRKLAGLAALASIPNTGLAQEGQGSQERIVLANSPLLYCSHHFQTPQGGRENLERNLRVDFESRENFWEDAMNGNAPNFFGLEKREYTLNDFITSLGYAKWDSLSKSTREKTSRTWKGFDAEFRRKLCLVYGDVYKNFYLPLDENKRTDFKGFVKAYRQAMQTASQQDNYSPQARIFTDADKSVSDCYERYFPWICLSLPNVADRAMIFAHEFKMHNGNRINWNYVRNS